MDPLLNEAAELKACTKEAERFTAVLLAMAAHDLRQPMQSISTSLGWLSGRLHGERERAFAACGMQAVRQLSRQLDCLVDALHVHERSAGIALGRVDLQELFTALKGENAKAADLAGHSLRIMPTAVCVSSDAMLLEGILRNLVRNALKYTPPGGRVLVGCRRHGHQVRIEVHDTGAGIPSCALVQIFDAFRRLDTTSSDGLGLGLFIVRRAADLLGHRVDVRSEIGRGSCFSVVANAAI